MKVSKRNQRRGGIRGTEDKFTSSRACLVQVSLSDTQVHTHLHKLYSKLTDYIMTISQNRISIAWAPITLYSIKRVE